MPDNSFDVVSKIEMPEVHNAIQQALKEVHQRFDLKDSHSNIEFNEKDNKILLHSKDEFKLKAVVDILQSKLIKRQVPLKGLTYGEIIPAAGSTVKQEITMQQGIPIEKARELVKKIKDSKLKMQASISGDFVRVAGKDRDTLQSVLALLRGTDFGIDFKSPTPRRIGRGGAKGGGPAGRPRGPSRSAAQRPRGGGAALVRRG